ncbi:Ig-like domain-containing protein [Natronosalvus rutilus]|uniref:Ig-like domain-containing protein n=1 Tax=Natronosalvus rutilus TaxID=2953753 RepID=A0A9E7ND84_9EURY|nr:Ig-like domain-containing protein [Natronosalvus rutilus]UTF54830.1 Ig-like domain-containing protein [Natronosalvus rutilus]
MSSSGFGDRARTVGIVVCVVMLIATSATAAIAGADGGVESTPSLASQANESGANDTNTTRHQNPDEYSEEGDLEGVERWLSGWLTDQLGGGAIQLSQGEYDRASQYVDEEYRDRLDQYVDVAGETEGESQEETFEDAQEEQRRTTETAHEYEETYEEYEGARATGDDERARELARELETLAEELNDSSTALRDHYEAIETETGADLSEPDTAIEEVNRDVQETQAEIREAEFVETELSIEATGPTTISFLEPLEARGQLQTVDGEAIANEPVRLEIGAQTLVTETDATGAFTVTYRPAGINASTTDLAVGYRPANESGYLGSQTDVPVSIEPVEPTLSDLEATDQARFDDQIQLTGAATVEDVPVNGLPLAVTLDGQRVGEVRVSEGQFNGTVTVPLSVPAGDQELRVAWPHEDRALAPANATTTVTITETDSALSMDAEPVAGDLQVTGRLTTADGDGVANQSVALTLDGDAVETVRTNADGRFEGELTPSADAESVTVGATYDDPGTSLAGAQAETTVTLATQEGSGLPTWLVAASGLGGVVALVLVGWWYRRAQPASTPAPDPEPPAEAESEDTGSTRALVRTQLAQAADQLANGQPDAAVERAYTAARHELASGLAAAGALTHWEFYHRYHERANEATRDRLRAITEGYERAAFDPTGLTESEAATVLERVREVCGLEAGASESKLRSEPEASDD